MKSFATRLLQGTLTVMGLVLLIFILARALPGDPARAFAGGLASADDVERIRKQMGLDRPMPVQVSQYVRRLAAGDLGKSVRSYEPVRDIIGRRIGRTVLLAGLALAAALLAGVALAILGARSPRTPLASLVTGLSVLSYGTPVFWVALVMIDLMAVRLAILPTGGYGTGKHLILPVSVLAFFFVGPIAQLLRASLLEVLAQDYIWVARAKGISEGDVYFRHALRNAVLPTLGYLGTQAGVLFGGAAITETIFAWHGLGSLLVTAALQRDYPVLQGCVLIIGLGFVVINSLLETLYEYVDPRLRSKASL